MWMPPKIDWDGDNDYYNFGDMDRVERNTSVIKEMIEYLQGQFDIEDIVSDRTMLSIEFADSLNRIERNIAALAAEFHAPLGWEPVKTDWKAGVGFSYVDANRLEKNLLILYELVQITADNQIYCGDFYCGEEVI